VLSLTPLPEVMLDEHKLADRLRTEGGASQRYSVASSTKNAFDRHRRACIMLLALSCVNLLTWKANLG
jgi:hypothetical protein